MSGNGIPFGALCVGMLLGLLYFSGLWWTVRRGIHSNMAALWFTASALLRMAIVVMTVYFIVARSGIANLIACLIGLLVARAMIVRAVRIGSTTRSAS